MRGGRIAPSSGTRGGGALSLSLGPKHPHCASIIASCLLPHDIMSCFLTDYNRANCFSQAPTSFPPPPSPSGFFPSRNTTINTGLGRAPPSPLTSPPPQAQFPLIAAWPGKSDCDGDSYNMAGDSHDMAGSGHNMAGSGHNASIEAAPRAATTALTRSPLWSLCSRAMGLGGGCMAATTLRDPRLQP